MQNEHNPMNDSIDSIKNFQKDMEAASANTEDVKNGTATKEEEQQEPGYILYNGIAETSIQIMQSPIISNLFDALNEKLGEDLTKKIVEAFTIMMTTSAYEAVVFYDELLKKELTNQFDSIAKSFSMISADVTAHTGVLEVFKKRLDDISKSLKIDEIKKEIGES